MNTSFPNMFTYSLKQEGKQLLNFIINCNAIPELFVDDFTVAMPPVFRGLFSVTAMDCLC